MQKKQSIWNIAWSEDHPYPYNHVEGTLCRGFDFDIESDFTDEELDMLLGWVGRKDGPGKTGEEIASISFPGVAPDRIKERLRSHPSFILLKPLSDSSPPHYVPRTTVVQSIFHSLLNWCMSETAPSMDIFISHTSRSLGGKTHLVDEEDIWAVLKQANMASQSEIDRSWSLAYPRALIKLCQHYELNGAFILQWASFPDVSLLIEVTMPVDLNPGKGDSFWGMLGEQEKYVMRRSILDGLNIQNIADELELTRGRVSQIENDAIPKLQHPYHFSRLGRYLVNALLHLPSCSLVNPQDLAEKFSDIVGIAFDRDSMERFLRTVLNLPPSETFNNQIWWLGVGEVKQNLPDYEKWRYDLKIDRIEFLT